MNLDSLYNIILRGGSIGSKFLFVFFIAKYSIDEYNLGVLGIINSSIAFLIYILGFDFYIFNSREILKDKKENVLGKLKNQMIFHLLLYSFFIPILLIVCYNTDFIPKEYILLFIPILLLEHLGQEFYRVFITLEKSVLANFILLLRSSLWIWLSFLDYYFNRQIILNTYLIYWVFNSLIINSISINILYKIIPLTKDSFKVDWRWIWNGIKSASTFFIGSLCFKVIQLSDRYMLDFYFTKKEVGVYTTYAQFVNIIDVFSFSAITMIAYPKLIKAYDTEQDKYDKEYKKFSKELIIVTFILTFLIFIIAPFIFQFLNKEMILENISSFNILLLGIVSYIISTIYHYDLYVRKKDVVILRITILVTLINILSNFILIPKFGIYGASLATLIAFLSILSLKYFFSKVKFIK